MANPKKQKRIRPPIRGRSKTGGVGKRPSFADFKRKIPKNTFSFKEHSGWVYADARGPKFVVVNHLQSEFSTRPHLLLRDGRGRPRFTLRHDPPKDGALRILSIQAERTQYSSAPKGLEYAFERERQIVQWDPALEKMEIAALRKQLNGMHPSEFLLSEFIHRHRAEINKGLKLMFEIQDRELDRKNYGPIISRFFSRKPVEKRGNILVFALNPNKVRVKGILEI